MASYRVETEEPRSFGLGYRNDLSGSVQYIGGVDGPDYDEPDVSPRHNSSSYQMPIGLEVLEKVDRFTIQQVVNPNDSWWSTLAFAVQDGRGQPLFDVKEIKSMNGCFQALLGGGRQYYMKVIDTNRNKWIMEFEHPKSCMSPILCPWSAPAMVVRMPTGEVLGQVKHSARETCGSCFPPSTYFDVFNHKGERTYSVRGPSCYPCECTSNAVSSFQLMKEDPEHKNEPMYIGEMSHMWRGPCGGVCSWCVTQEPDSVSLSFPKDTPVEDKAVFLALLFLMLATYLEVQ